MLRAVRFAATLGFRLEESTFADICEMAPQMNVVSAERIAEEMRMILVQPARVRAVGLLLATGLLAAILPEAATVAGSENWSGDLQTETDFVTKHLSSPSALTLRLLNAVENPSFPLALAILLHSVHSQDLGRTIGGQWKLARTETDRLAWLLENQNSLAQAQSKRWSRLQPLLIAEGADDLLKLHAAKAAVGLINPHDVVYCRTRLGRPAAELNPAPFVTGADLLSLHIPAGPIFARLLRAAREAQLDDVVVDRAAALELIKRLWGEVQ
jgi:poly(A) polymerase